MHGAIGYISLILTGTVFVIHIKHALPIGLLVMCFPFWGNILLHWRNRKLALGWNITFKIQNYVVASMLVNNKCIFTMWLKGQNQFFWSLHVLISNMDYIWNYASKSPHKNKDKLDGKVRFFPPLILFSRRPCWGIISLHTRSPFVNATLLWDDIEAHDWERRFAS